MRALIVAIVVAVGLGVSAPVPALAEPPQTHEILVNRPSGFWTSNRPAEGGSYRYRLMGIGAAITLGMGWLIWRLARKK